MSDPIATDAIRPALERLLSASRTEKTVNPLDVNYFAQLFRGEAPMPTAVVKDPEVAYLVQQLKIQQASLSNIALSKEIGFVTGAISKLLSMS